MVKYSNICVSKAVLYIYTHHLYLWEVEWQTIDSGCPGGISSGGTLGDKMVKETVFHFMFLLVLSKCFNMSMYD